MKNNLSTTLDGFVQIGHNFWPVIIIGFVLGVIATLANAVGMTETEAPR